MNTAPKILVVDDDSRVRKFLKDALTHIHPRCTVVTAEDGVDALTKLIDVHLVITDCIMPRMDGIQLCSHIRRLNRGIKVVLVTGKVPYAEIPHDLFDDILMKPFTVGDIEQTINNLFPHQR
jgi:CheY-like chemotaxis protein